MISCLFFCVEYSASIKEFLLCKNRPLLHFTCQYLNNKTPHLISQFLHQTSLGIIFRNENLIISSSDLIWFVTDVQKLLLTSFFHHSNIFISCQTVNNLFPNENILERICRSVNKKTSSNRLLSCHEWRLSSKMIPKISSKKKFRKDI